MQTFDSSLITSLDIGNPAAVNYGLNTVYTDDSGNLYLWLPSAGEASTSSFLKGFTVGTEDITSGITNVLLAITSYRAETGEMRHSPEALLDEPYRRGVEGNERLPVNRRFRGLHERPRGLHEAPRQIAFLGQLSFSQSPATWITPTPVFVMNKIGIFLPRK